MKSSIKTKFLIPTVLLIFLAMSISSTISYFQSKNALNTLTAEQIIRQADSISVMMTSWVDGFSRRKSSEKLTVFKQDYNSFESINLADKNGMVTASSDESLIDTEKVDTRKFFKTAMKGEFVTSEIFKSTHSKKPVFAIAAPIMLLEEITGVIYAVIDFSVFSDVFITPVTNLAKVSGLTALISVIIAVFIILFITGSITKPLNEVVNRLKDAVEGEGDLTTRINVKSKNEIGDHAGSFNIFISKIQGIIKDVAVNSKNLSVSASEIKELAAQTAEATDAIKLQVESIQTSTGNTVSKIKSINGIITQINDIVTTIASAVEEQSASTKKIAGNIAQVSSGLDDISTSMSHSSQSVEEITSEIAEVSESAGGLFENSNTVQEKAGGVVRPGYRTE